MPQIVKAKAMPLRNLHARLQSCRPEMVCNKDSGRQRHSALSHQRRKYEVRLLGVRRLCMPFLEVIGKSRVKRDVTFCLTGLRWPVLARRPAFGDCNPCLFPEHVTPSKSKQFRKAQCRCLCLPKTPSDLERL